MPHEASQGRRTLNYIYDRQRPDPTALVSPTGSKSSRRQSYKAVFEGITDFTDTEAAALRLSAGIDRTVWTPESGPDQDEAPTWEEIAAEMRSNYLSRCNGRTAKSPGGRDTEDNKKVRQGISRLPAAFEKNCSSPKLLTQT